MRIFSGRSIGRSIVLLGLLALGGANTGCSFIFVDGVPSEHAKLAYFDCTSTYGLSVADGLIALSGGIGAGMALSQSKQEYADKNNGANRNAAAGVNIALAGVLAGSALYGAIQATRCDRAKDDLKARIFAAPLRPPPPPPPWPPLPASPVQPPQPGNGAGDQLPNGQSPQTLVPGA
jgi:hypothetical protein